LCNVSEDKDSDKRADDGATQPTTARKFGTRKLIICGEKAQNCYSVLTTLASNRQRRRRKNLQLRDLKHNHNASHSIWSLNVNEFVPGRCMRVRTRSHCRRHQNKNLGRRNCALTHHNGAYRTTVENACTPKASVLKTEMTKRTTDRKDLFGAVDM